MPRWAVKKKILTNHVACDGTICCVQTCRVSSCTEWCLSKGGGACHQIYVRVRQNGTDVDFEVNSKLAFNISILL